MSKWRDRIAIGLHLLVLAAVGCVLMRAVYVWACWAGVDWNCYGVY